MQFALLEGCAGATSSAAAATTTTTTFIMPAVRPSSGHFGSSISGAVSLHQAAHAKAALLIARRLECALESTQGGRQCIWQRAEGEKVNPSGHATSRGRQHIGSLAWLGRLQVAAAQRAIACGGPVRVESHAQCELGSDCPAPAVRRVSSSVPLGSRWPCLPSGSLCLCQTLAGLKRLVRCQFMGHGD